MILFLYFKGTECFLKENNETIAYWNDFKVECLLVWLIQFMYVTVDTSIFSFILKPPHSP